ncbi:MAG: ortholog of Bordetella pertussis (BX470248) BP2101, partial [uncultured Acetobacteraceae bacterium]
ARSLRVARRRPRAPHRRAARRAVRPGNRMARPGRRTARREQSAALGGAGRPRSFLGRHARPVGGDDRHQLRAAPGGVRPRPRLHRRHVPPGQRLPDHRGLLARPQRADARVRPARPLRLLPRLRMERQHRARRRPQRGAEGRGPDAAPLLPRPGRRPFRRRPGRARRARPAPQAARGGRRALPAARRRALRRPRPRARPDAGTLGRGAQRLGHLRLAADGRFRGGRAGRHRGEFRRPQGAPRRVAPGRLAVRRLWRLDVLSRARPVARGAVGRDAVAPAIRDDRGVPRAHRRRGRARRTGRPAPRRPGAGRRACREDGAGRPRRHPQRRGRRGGGVHRRNPGRRAGRARRDPQPHRPVGDLAPLRRTRPGPAHPRAVGGVRVPRPGTRDEVGRHAPPRRERLARRAADQPLQPRPPLRGRRHRPRLRRRHDRRLHGRRSGARRPRRRDAGDRNQPRAGQLADRHGRLRGPGLRRRRPRAADPGFPFARHQPASPRPHRAAHPAPPRRGQRALHPRHAGGRECPLVQPHLPDTV